MVFSYINCPFNFFKWFFVYYIFEYFSRGGRHFTDIMQQLSSSDGEYHGIRLTDLSAEESLKREKYHVVTTLCDLLDTGYSDINMQVLSSTIIADLSHWPQSLTDDIGKTSVKFILSGHSVAGQNCQYKINVCIMEMNYNRKHYFWHRSEVPEWGSCLLFPYSGRSVLNELDTYGLNPYNCLVCSSLVVL